MISYASFFLAVVRLSIKLGGEFVSQRRFLFHVCYGSSKYVMALPCHELPLPCHFYLINCHVILIAALWHGRLGSDNDSL